jgi:hypothetical protein
VRGLDFADGLFVIGSSEHRYPEKLAGLTMNISLDTGVFVFDAAHKLSRFLNVPQTESIHSVLIE